MYIYCTDAEDQKILILHHNRIRSTTLMFLNVGENDILVPHISFEYFFKKDEKEESVNVDTCLKLLDIRVHGPVLT